MYPDKVIEDILKLCKLILGKNKKIYLIERCVRHAPRRRGTVESLVLPENKAKLQSIRVKLEWKNIFCIKEKETYVKIYSLTGKMFAICPPLRFVVESLLPENTQRKFLKVNRRL